MNKAAAVAAAAKSLQSCLNLCGLIDSSPPGSPIPGILQARTLEWVAIASSIVTSRPSLKRNAKGRSDGKEMVPMRNTEL